MQRPLSSIRKMHQYADFRLMYPVKDNPEKESQVTTHDMTVSDHHQLIRTFRFQGGASAFSARHILPEAHFLSILVNTFAVFKLDLNMCFDLFDPNANFRLVELILDGQ